MRTYLICYDIAAPKRHAVAGAVMELGEAWARPLDATWYVQSAERADAIERRLRPFADTGDGLLIQAVDDTIDRAREFGDLAARTWSEMNVAAYRHPLASSVPLFGRWLNMPAVPVPGDLFTVRLHWGAVTSSERMVVSPGNEAAAILHMPTGQSGHPLSPYYANSHLAWVKGAATPMLPGRAEHRLTLTP